MPGVSSETVSPSLRQELAAMVIGDIAHDSVFNVSRLVRVCCSTFARAGVSLWPRLPSELEAQKFLAAGKTYDLADHIAVLHELCMGTRCSKHNGGI